MKSVMQRFSRVPTADIQRSTFDRSHGHKTTLDAGYLVPIYTDLAFPGDVFNLKLSAFGRLATPLKPIMDNLFLETFFFSVPIRLIWTNFPKFMGEQTDPGDSIDYTVPTMTTPSGSDLEAGELHDYLGIPPYIRGLQFNSLWHRGYNLCYREWFRDQNMVDSPVVDTDDGPDTITDYVLRRRSKRPDYFTSALPWPQKGDAITIPLGTTAPVVSDGNYIELTNNTTDSRITSNASNAYMTFNTAPGAGEAGTAWLYNDAGLQTDLTNATAQTINALREAFQLQKMLERDARSGTRYIEVVKAHFNVDSPDLRAVRPVYLGGGSSLINVHPVAQTGETGTTPQGNLTAFATASVNDHGFTYAFTEHCIVIGLVNVRADLTYQRGLDRMFSYQTRYDFYFPSLAHLGEQEVLNKEIYAQGQGNPTEDAAVFGYQERFAELRYKPSRISGLFNSLATGTLDIWHLAQKFTSLPTLSESFIEDNPPIDRVIATPDEPHILLDCYFDLKCTRPMPVYSVPGLIDHF